MRFVAVLSNCVKGQLSFLNSMEYESWADGSAGASTIPTISGNDEFAYGVFDWEEYCCTQFSAFARITGGALEINNTMNVVGPTGNPSGPWYYFPLIAKADPTNHLAVLMYSEDDLVVRQNSIWYKNVMSFKFGTRFDRGFQRTREELLKTSTHE